MRRASLVDAVLVMDVETEDARLPMLRALGLPCVLIGHPDGAAEALLRRPGPRPGGCARRRSPGGPRPSRDRDAGSPAAVYETRSTYAIQFAEGSSGPLPTAA